MYFFTVKPTSCQIVIEICTHIEWCLSESGLHYDIVQEKVFNKQTRLAMIWWKNRKFSLSAYLIRKHDYFFLYLWFLWTSHLYRTVKIRWCTFQNLCSQKKRKQNRFHEIFSSIITFKHQYFSQWCIILIISERYPFIDSWLSVEDYLGKAGVSSLI